MGSLRKWVLRLPMAPVGHFSHRSGPHPLGSGDPIGMTFDGLRFLNDRIVFGGKPMAGQTRQSAT